MVTLIYLKNWLGFGSQNLQNRLLLLQVAPKFWLISWWLLKPKSCTTNLNFSQSLTLSQPALSLKNGHQKFLKTLLEVTREKPTTLALKPLWFSNFFFALSHTWKSEFLERENGKSLADFSQFLGPKTDPPYGLFIGEQMGPFANIFGLTFAHKSLEQK